jgi:predicted phage terminase large subunit-like protein
MMQLNDLPIIVQRKALNIALRKDFTIFLRKAFLEAHGSPLRWNWHHEVICDDLMAQFHGKQRRIIINVPPRSLKSFICSVAFPAWLMGLNPRMKIIGVSYSQDLANKFSRDQRALMQSAWYQEVFPDARINPRKAGEAEFEIVGEGFRLATSCGGMLTGRGADLIIIDDPIKPQDAFSDALRKSSNDWIDNTLMSRLDDKQRGSMLLVMQRLHEEDATGHLLSKGGWLHRSFQAIAMDDEYWELSNGRYYTRLTGDVLHPQHEPKSVLDDLKRDLGTLNFSAQYQQHPIPVEGNIIRKEWFRYFTSLPQGEKMRCVLSLDTAMKDGAGNDWTVCTVWLMHTNDYFLVDLVRAKMAFPQIKQMVGQLKDRYNPAYILIEDKGSGTSLIQQLRTEGIHCTPIKAEVSKLERLASASVAFEQHRVFFPQACRWLEVLQHELLGFPAVKHDDQVDSVSQFLNWALIGRGYVIGSGRVVGLF